MENSIADRIKQIIKVKKMNAAQFARAIDENPSKLSHIFSGRNNASVKIISKITSTFPDINYKWISEGKGNMIVNDNNLQNNSTYPDLFTNNSNQKNVNNTEMPFVNKLHQQNLQPKDVNNTLNTEKKSKHIKKIIVYYTDNTYEEFSSIK